ncbi:MAG TPA: pyruvate, water dikinase regulatory protein [Coriobacteriia bacterium]|nr:pyruvate, water dikinase regulatory protein [Coriobacteriia bacterium]
MTERLPISIHVVSDSLGETGEMVARAAVGQFEPDSFRIERLPKIESPEQLRREVKSHCGRYCIFFYTLVDQSLCDEMRKLCDEGVNGVDLLSPALRLLIDVTGYEPTGEAGSIRRTDEDYFDRIEAMEFAVKHDDGRNPEGYIDADVVLVGVSRTSKTPLSMYLAFKGIRVANYPFAPGIDPPRELFEVDPRKVFGLVTDPEVLLEIRRERMRELGTWVPGYAERESVEVELEEARALMRRIGCLVVHTDNRAVEEAAQEILRHINEAVHTSD